MYSGFGPDHLEGRQGANPLHLLLVIGEQTISEVQGPLLRLDVLQAFTSVPVDILDLAQTVIHLQVKGDIGDLPVAL